MPSATHRSANWSLYSAVLRFDLRDRSPQLLHHKVCSGLASWPVQAWEALHLQVLWSLFYAFWSLQTSSRSGTAAQLRTYVWRKIRILWRHVNYDNLHYTVAMFCNEHLVSHWSVWIVAGRAKQVLAHEDPIPADVQAAMTQQYSAYAFSRFKVEVRMANSEPYPSPTIHPLLCGLHRHMREISPGCPNFLDIRNSMALLMHISTTDGVGQKVQHTESVVFTKGEEEKLRDSGILGANTPKHLQNG